MVYLCTWFNFQILSIDQGWGVTKAWFVDFSISKIFSILQKYLLDLLNHIHVWRLSPQLSTCQVWMWYSIAKVCFDSSEKLGKWWNRGNWLSNPDPCCGLHLRLSKVLANERRCYLCNVFFHWLKPCSAVDGKTGAGWFHNLPTSFVMCPSECLNLIVLYSKCPLQSHSLKGDIMGLLSIVFALHPHSYI